MHTIPLCHRVNWLLSVVCLGNKSTGFDKFSF
jgi:hypothetical protein